MGMPGAWCGGERCWKPDLMGGEEPLAGRAQPPGFSDWEERTTAEGRGSGSHPPSSWEGFLFPWSRDEEGELRGRQEEPGRGRCCADSMVRGVLVGWGWG